MYRFLYLANPNQTLFICVIVFLAVVLISGGLVARYLSKKLQTMALTATAVIALGIACFAFLVTVFILISVSESCAPKVGDTFHQFNAHIKDVCLERATLAECPKTEAELAEFNPQKYQSLQSCTQTQYQFDESTGEVHWSVRYDDNHVLVSGINYPKFGYVSFDEAKQQGYWR